MRLFEKNVSVQVFQRHWRKIHLQIRMSSKNTELDIIRLKITRLSLIVVLGIFPHTFSELLQVWTWHCIQFVRQWWLHSVIGVVKFSIPDIKLNITCFRIESNCLINLKVQTELALDHWVKTNKWTPGTEQIEGSHEQEQQTGRDQYSKDEFVKALSRRSKCLYCIVSISSPANKHFPVVKEQLPELEYIQTCFTESEI